MAHITPFLVRIARWWTVLLVYGASLTSFQILFWLEAQFTTLTGIPVFDTQNALTADQLLTQLPSYQGAARTAYYYFAAFDFLFPFVAAAALALLWAWLLRGMTWRIGAIGLAWQVPALAFIVTLFDWLENIFLLVVIASDGDAGMGAITAALTAKRLKLIGLALSGIVSLGLLVAAIANQIANWLARRPTSRSHPERLATHAG